MCPRSDPGTGSPPRGRGKVFPRARRAAGRGIIPALAGKSPAPLIQSLDSRDHPRVGGEKWLYLDDFFCLAGSPPHRRGKVGLDGGLSEAVGITPAQAGKSKLALCTPSCPTDHPRAGGEKVSPLSAVALSRGSPPHGRGKERRVVDHHPLPGITPAQAGKRIRRPDTERAYWDHPCVGGEKMLTGNATDDETGSPPHGRGKVSVCTELLLGIGITPAWAGKSAGSSGGCSASWDHPRVGGEKMHSERMPPEMTGSPPRRRGKVIVYITAWRVAGITPARRGKAAQQGARLCGTRITPA